MARAQLILQSDDRRLGERRDIEVVATLRDEAARPLDVTILQISNSGCLIRSPAPLSVGARVSVGLVGLPVTEATIVHRDRELYGCRFDQATAMPTLPAPDGETNVYRLPPSADGSATEAVEQATDRLPIAARVAIIVSVSALLWLGVIALVVLSRAALR